MRRYLSELLLVQIVATYLVVLGHSYPFTIEVPGWLTRAQVFLYTFHMPLFVWISGYLLVYTRQVEKAAYSTFAKKRFLKLLIPYFALSIIALVPKYALQPYLNDSLSLDGRSILQTFFAPRLNVWGHFWFLPMIFIQGAVCFVADRAFIRLGIRKIGWWFSFAITFILYVAYYGENLTYWLSVSDLVKFSWVFALGCLCGCYGVIDQMNRHRSAFLTLGAFAVAVLLFESTTPLAIAAVKSGLIAVTMIYTLVALCVTLAKKINIAKDALYAQTFTIFLLSWPCQAVANVLIERILMCPYYIVMPVQFCAGIAGPMILTYLISKIETKYEIHWISFLLGK